MKTQHLVSAMDRIQNTLTRAGVGCDAQSPKEIENEAKHYGQTLRSQGVKEQEILKKVSFRFPNLSATTLKNLGIGG